MKKPSPHGFVMIAGVRLRRNTAQRLVQALEDRDLEFAVAARGSADHLVRSGAATKLGQHVYRLWA